MPPDPLQLPETGCDHTDGYGSTVVDGDICLLCNRTVPPRIAEITRGYAVIDLLMGAIAGFVIGLLAGRLV